jgi:hypothetical protein
MASRPAHNPRNPYIHGNAPTKLAVSSGAQTLEFEQLRRLLTSSNGTATWTTGTAASIYADMGGASLVEGDYIDVIIVNTHASQDITVAGGTGVTLVGDGVVEPAQASGETNSGSAVFRLQWTAVGGSPTADIIRVA